MRRSPVALLLAVCAAGVVAVLVGGLVRQTPRGFTIGVPASIPAISLKARHVVCQRPIAIPAGGAFDRVRLVLGTFARPAGPALDVTVRSAAGRVLSRGTVAAGFPDITKAPSQVVALDDRVGAGSALQVCIANRGPRAVGLYGAGEPASRTSSAYEGAKALGVDVSMSFERAPRSELGLAGRVFDRASLFRFPGQGRWLYWAAAVVCALLVPLVLAAALCSALSARE